FFLIASIAICGLPPLNGFVGELMIYLGFYQGIQSHTAGLWTGSVIGVAALALIGALSLFSFVRLFSMVFQGFPRYQSEQRPQEAPRLMKLSMIPLVAGMLVIGLFPQAGLRLIRMPLAAILPGLSIPDALTAVMTTLSFFMAGLILLCLILFGLRRRLIKNKNNHDYKTWDCGYQAPTSRMQYTAASFADPVVGLFSRLYVLRDIRQPVEGLFPRHASFGSIIHDWLEKKVLDPVLGLIRNAFGWLQLFQSGQTQHYILFGLILLMLIIIWIIGAL
ncbi:MAG: hypothetical protein KBA26_14950, partial [Candidatus Delongbacteria bacterium]|nr:hypothetical protein [Candidatus Delongbacteria bacterium]